LASGMRITAKVVSFGYTRKTNNFLCVINSNRLDFRPPIREATVSDQPNPQGKLPLVHYETPGCVADLPFDPSNETIWATQQQIADLFSISTNTVGEHLRNIFRDGELDETAVARKFRATGKDGKNYNYLHYNLDAVLSVGYRVSSKKATEFRRWATQTLREYITQGFAINEARLKDDPHALRELAAKVRALRSDEANIYKGVRDVFAFASSDYSKDAPDIGRFFALLQDKFTYAVTGQRSSQILLQRANHLIRDMGLQTMSGSRPSHADVRVAKNYLFEDELYKLHMLCEHFLLFVESAALRGMKLTMRELLQKFDDLAGVIGHPVFTDYQDALAERARRHAIRELELYQELTVKEANAARRKIA
jgi:hypothetical protein